MEEDLVNDRQGEVWVGEHDGQEAFLLLWQDDLSEDDVVCEKYIAFNLLTGKMSHLITRGIESDLGWVRYR